MITDATCGFGGKEVEFSEETHFWLRCLALWDHRDSNL